MFPFSAYQRLKSQHEVNRKNKTKVLHRLETGKDKCFISRQNESYHRPQKPVVGVLTDFIYRKMVVSVRLIHS